MTKRKERDTGSIPPVFEAVLLAVLFAACLIGSAL